MLFTPWAAALRADRSLLDPPDPSAAFQAWSALFVTVPQRPSPGSQSSWRIESGAAWST